MLPREKLKTILLLQTREKICFHWVLYNLKLGHIKISSQNSLHSHSLKGGLFFAKPMRENNYISMMDPFRRKYGKHLTAALAVVPVITEIVWIPALMISLGTTTQTNMQTFNLGTVLSVIPFYNELPVSDCAPGATMSTVLDLSFSLCVWISAAVAISYTVLGGLYSVTSTDVIQILLVLAGLVGLEATIMSEMMWFKCTPLTQALPVPFPVLFVCLFYSGCVSLLFWSVTITLTLLKQRWTTCIRPPGLATSNPKTSGDGLIISWCW